MRPERMTEASIICLKKDFDTTLEALDEFGNFHIKEIKQDSKEDYEDHLRRIRETLQDINTLTSQLKTEKSGLLDIFKSEKIIKTEITAENWQNLLKTVESETLELKSKTANLTDSLKKINDDLTKLEQINQMLTILNREKINLDVLNEMQFVYVAVVNISSKNVPALETALSNINPTLVHHRAVTTGQEFVFVATSTKHKEEIDKILKNHDTERFQIPKEYPENTSEALQTVDDQTKKLMQTKKAILSDFEKLADENSQRLFELEETAQNISNVLISKQKSLETIHLVTVKGFVPKKEFSAFATKMDDKVDKMLFAEKNDETKTSQDVDQDPPTKIKNHFFAKPFETITGLYGVPHYDELDPTPILAITFPLLFGFMFGDAGHGLVLLSVGLALGLLVKNNQGIRSFAWILAACGIGAIFAGLLFGEFFGISIFPPLWFDPFEDVTDFLLFSLFIGIFQIMTGFVLEFVNYILKGNIIDAIATSLCKMLFYAGGIYLIVAYQLNFGQWLQGPILLPLIPFVFLIVGKPMIVKILQKTGHPPKMSTIHESFIERVFESGDLVTRLISNTMSYARILALLMAHWALILVTYTISDMVFPAPIIGTIVGAIVIIGGNVFVMAFEGLIVFIHTLRLHFYEWFSKFYDGTGTPFSPFKQRYKYTKIIFKK